MRKLFVLMIICLSGLAKAQFTDSLSDGNFILNPVWSGSSTWQVNASLQLQSNGTVADTSYLSTPSTSIDNTEWRFYIKQTFAGSANNFGRVYLVSDQADLKNPLNGYFLLFGEAGSNDSVRLYRQDGLSTSAVPIAAGLNASIVNGINASVKVTRNNTGLWKLYIDYTGGTNYLFEDSVIDNTYNSTSFFGVFAKYTASNATSFFYDNFYVGPIAVDVTPPFVISATAINNTQVDVLFSEAVELITSQTAGNYFINNGIINPSNAVRDITNNALVHLSLSPGLTNNTNYTITINNVSDLSSNIIAANSTANFSYIVPGTAQFGDVIINELYPDQTPLVGLPNAEFVEIYNRSSTAFNLNGWVLSDPSSNANIGNYNLLPGQYLILCANGDTSMYQPYGPTKGVPSFPSLNSSDDVVTLKDNNGVFIDSVNYDDTWYQDAVKQDGGWTLELKNPNIPSNCAGANNWIASNAIAGGTPGQINSVYTGTADITPPSVATVIALDPLHITICFDEPLQLSQAQTINNYSVGSGIGNPSAITYSGNCVVLTLSNPLSPTLNYTVTFSNLSDCSGNAMINLNYTFTYFVPQPFDVVINEIMADATPIVGLPDAEYLELFNRTNFPINIGGWSLTYGSTQKTLPPVVLPPDSFLVLTTSAGLAELSIYGNVASVSTLSSTALTNSGTTLTLKDNNNVLIHSVNYSDQWYNDAVKILGGWSLEMIDPSNPCAAGTNWTASVNPEGGTPGKRNSVLGTNPDNIPPALGSATIITASQVEVEFTEPIINSSALSAANFSIDNTVGTPSSISFSGIPVNKVTLTLSVPLQLNTIYTVTLTIPVTDCSGNSTTGNISAQFANYNAKPFDIVINEIMADPDPAVGLPAYEYVELYNRSAYPINLNKWKLKYSSSIRDLPPASIDPGEYIILTSPAGANLLSTYGNVVSLAGFSSSALANSGTTLILTDTIGNVIHAVEYSDSWYSNDKIDGGWSLEQIDPNNPCGGINNWKASNAIEGGTPGTVNSINATNADINPPTISSICINGPNVITVQFNEPQDSLTMANASYYSGSNGLGTPSAISLEGPLYDKISLTFNSSFIANVIYTLTVTGALMDCAGNTIAGGTTEDFSIYDAMPYEIVINEIMADEEPVVGLPAGEYIELFNRSSFPVSLSSYNLSVGSSNTVISCASIRANGYLVVLPKGEINNEPVYGKCYVAENFSSITNTGQEITLKDKTGNTLSSVTFTDQWYGNSDKASGGWSLEQVDPGNPCAGSGNWSASSDVTGGTPGKVNSINAVNADLIAPEILRIAYFSPTTIIIYFTEPLQASTIINASSYNIDNGIGNPLFVFGYAPTYNKVSLVLPVALQQGVIYTLNITGSIADCVGNPINTTITGRFGIPGAVHPGDLILNELLFNPLEDGVDFVEFYNKSSKLLTLNNVEMANIDTVQNLLSDKSIIDTTGYLVFPNEYYVLSTSGETVLKQYKTTNPKGFIDVASMPSMSVSEGSFALCLKNDSVVDGIMYTESMHYPLLNDKKGKSLERISFNRNTGDITNWHTASETVGFATPGYKNSQFVDDEEATDVISFNNEIFSPDNDGYNDVLTVNFNVAEPGWVANSQVYDVKGRLIQKVLENRLLGTQGSFSWDGISSDNEKASIGVYTLYFEYFNTKGDVKKVRRSFVLAGKL